MVARVLHNYIIKKIYLFICLLHIPILIPKLKNFFNFYNDKEHLHD